MMKKNIFSWLILLLLLACSPRKDGFTNRNFQKFNTYYNTLFNGNEALNSEMKSREKAHVDDFHQSYIQLLIYDNVPETDDENSSEEEFKISEFASPSEIEEISQEPLQIAEQKALKAIKKHAMLFGGEEKNKMIFDVHILLAKSRIYQDRPLEALDAINYLLKNMKKDKRIALAKIHEGLAYSKMKNYYRAIEIFRDLDNTVLKKEYRKILSIHYAETLLAFGNKTEAVEQLEKAFVANKNRDLKSRIAFLRGQILLTMKENKKAGESFETAYKFSNHFQFQVRSQIEIAKSMLGNLDDYEKVEQSFINISKKGIFASRKNEFYYALGLLAQGAGKKEKAKQYFIQSIKEKASDHQVRGSAYHEVGKMYFAEDDYIRAGAYYDSAMVAMNHEPTKRLFKKEAQNIKEFSKKYYIVKKNDSILSLAKMSDAELINYFNQYIADLKEKEAQLIRNDELKKKQERNKAFQSGNESFSNADFSTFGNSKGGFYFANKSTIAKGEVDFKKTWGTRVLADNWRFSPKTKGITGDKDIQKDNSKANPRRFEHNFYTEKIPKDERVLSDLKKERDSASLALGDMYETFFGNRPLATKTLYDLVDQGPEQEIKLQALYMIFAMNYENHPEEALRAKTIILQEFPHTSYAEYVKNPKSASFSTSDTAVENAYSEAYDLYAKEKYAESKTIIKESVEKYPKDALVPKFELLNAFNTGKTAGKEVMILQLEQIVLNYSNTGEGQKAKDLLKFLKSDLDAEGNPLQKPVTKPKKEQYNSEQDLENQLEKIDPEQNKDDDEELLFLKKR